MKPMTAEWVEKAEGDFAMVLRESRAARIHATTELVTTPNSAPKST